MDIIAVTDASSYGIRSVISHIFPDESEKAITNTSRYLTSVACNYGQIKKEALEFMFAPKKFHKMLYSWHFTLVPDHKILVSIFRKVSQFIELTVCNAGPQCFWTMTSTSNISQVDALSRLMDSHHKHTEDIVVPRVSLVLASTIQSLPVTAAMLSEATSITRKIIHFQQYEPINNFNLSTNINPLSLMLLVVFFWLKVCWYYWNCSSKSSISFWAPGNQQYEYLSSQLCPLGEFEQALGRTYTHLFKISTSSKVPLEKWTMFMV